jgi:hypothetical protein
MSQTIQIIIQAGSVRRVWYYQLQGNKLQYAGLILTCSFALLCSELLPNNLCTSSCNRNTHKDKENKITVFQTKVCHCGVKCPVTRKIQSSCSSSCKQVSSHDFDMYLFTWGINILLHCHFKRSFFYLQVHFDYKLTVSSICLIWFCIKMIFFLHYVNNNIALALFT